MVEGGRDATAHAEHMRRTIYAHLAPRPPRDVELGRIDMTLRTLSRAQRRDHAQVGGRWGCDTLLIGTLTEYRRRYFGLYSDIAVGAQVELIRARDGERVWEARHVAVSRGGGLPISPLALVEGAVRAVTNIIGEQLDRLTDDLARRLVAALPVTTLAPSEALAERAGDGPSGHREAIPQPAGMPDAGGLI